MMLGREFFNLIAALYLQINDAVLLMKKIMFSAQKDPVATMLQCHAIIRRSTRSRKAFHSSSH